MAPHGGGLFGGELGGRDIVCGLPSAAAGQLRARADLHNARRVGGRIEPIAVADHADCALFDAAMPFVSMDDTFGGRRLGA